MTKITVTNHKGKAIHLDNIPHKVMVKIRIAMTEIIDQKEYTIFLEANGLMKEMQLIGRPNVTLSEPHVKSVSLVVTEDGKM